MKWHSEYRAGAIEVALVSLWFRCLLFVAAVLSGTATAAAIRDRGIPSWGEVLGPIPFSIVLWIFFPRFLMAFAVTIIGLARVLQTESNREVLGWLLCVAGVWAWGALAIW